MKSIIYVPQGHSARLHNASASYDIEGLYTDHFSTCNIIVCIGQERIALIHVDVQMQVHPNKIKEELEWVGEPNETIFIIREKGKFIQEQLVKYFQSVMPNKEFIYKHMDDEHDGVFVSFQSQQDATIHPQIIKYPLGRRPQNLLHHPQEERFITVQKIEQIIGLRAKVKTNKSRVKHTYIFDGRAWEPLEDWHLMVDTSHKLTQEEMDFFNKNDPYIVMAGKLAGIIDKAKKAVPFIGELKELAMPTAVYLEAYLNNFDYELLFKRNLVDLLDGPKHVSGYDPISAEDKNLKKQLLQLFKSKSIVFNEAVSIINQYKDSAPQTEFKKNILDEFQTFSRHYQERKYYRDLAATYAQKLETAKKHTERAVKAYQDKSYNAAANLFLDILKEVTHCCTKAHLDLAATYYNLGRSLQQAGSFEEAKFFLDISLACKKNYVMPKPLVADIEKTERAIRECELKIKEKMNTNQTKPTLIYN